MSLPKMASKACKIGDVPETPQQTVSNTKFDDLNDDCIRLILGLFTIQEQLELRRTAPRWNVAVCTNLRAKNSLKLFPDFDGMCMQYQQLITLYNSQDDAYYHLQEHDPDELIGRRVTDAVADALRTPSHLPMLFPNLSKLVLFNRKSTRETRSNMTNIPGLLRDWQQLESLTIFDLPAGCCKPISTMPQLRRLELYNVDFALLTPLKPFLAILGNLEQFTLGKCTSTQIPKLLAALNPDHLRRLSLNRVNLSVEQLRVFFNAKPTLAGNLSHLTVCIAGQGSNFECAKSYGMKLDLLQLIVERCHSLTFLQFSITKAETSLISVFTALTSLQHLTELKIDCAQTLLQRLTPVENPNPTPNAPHVRPIVLANVRRLDLSLSYLEILSLPTFANFLVPIFTGLQELVVMSQSSFSRNVDEEYTIWRQHFASVPKLTVYAKFFAFTRYIGPRYESRHNIAANEERFGVFSDIFRRLGELLRLVPQMQDMEQFQRHWEQLRGLFEQVREN